MSEAKTVAAFKAGTPASLLTPLALPCVTYDPSAAKLARVLPPPLLATVQLVEREPRPSQTLPCSPVGATRALQFSERLALAGAS